MSGYAEQYATVSNNHVSLATARRVGAGAGNHDKGGPDQHRDRGRHQAHRTGRPTGRYRSRCGGRRRGHALIIGACPDNPAMHLTLRMRLALLAIALLASPFVATAQPLPPEVDAALARAKVPRDAVSFLVVDTQGRAAPRLSHRAQVPMNPASVMKLVTTYAALDLLGPAYQWTTPVFVDGPVVQRRAARQPLHSGPGRPQAGAGAPVAAAAPRAGPGHQNHCGRHRAGPHRAGRARGGPGQV